MPTKTAPKTPPKTAARTTPGKQANSRQAAPQPPQRMDMAGRLPVKTEPAAIRVKHIAGDQEGVSLRLGVPASYIRQRLDEIFGPGGWCVRRYACAGVLYTALGIYNPAAGEYVYKDAPAPSLQNATIQQQADTGFVEAAKVWGICADVAALPPIRISAQQAAIVPVPAANGKTNYMLAKMLHVAQLAWDERGKIINIQLEDDAGGRILWPTP